MNRITRKLSWAPILAGALLVPTINLVQFYFYSTQPYRTIDPDGFGFPMPVYEYHVWLSRGRVLWLGILANILLSIALGLTIVKISAYFGKNCRSISLK